MQQRVFVSSVVKGFEEYRRAAERGIVAAGGEPVMMEKQPSLPKDSRNACLDAVESSDIYIVIVGSRGGWTAPSGQLAVEEEYEEARRLKKTILAFVQKTQRDAEAERLEEKVSHYTQGHFRSTFSTPDELEGLVEESLTPIIQARGKAKVSKRVFDAKLGGNTSNSFRQEDTSLRFVLSPEYEDEFIDQVAIGSQDFINQVRQIGHLPQVSLFNYEQRNTCKAGMNEITFFQDRDAQTGEKVQLEISTIGMLVIAINAIDYGPRNQSSLMQGSVILESQIVAKLRKCFAFVGEFFEVRDKFGRYSTLQYNVALCEMGYKPLVKEMPTGGVTLNINSPYSQKPLIAFDEPQLLGRNELLAPSKQIEAVLSLFYRRLSAGKPY